MFATPPPLSKIEEVCSPSQGPCSRHHRLRFICFSTSNLLFEGQISHSLQTNQSREQFAEISVNDLASYSPIMKFGKFYIQIFQRRNYNNLTQLIIIPFSFQKVHLILPNHQGFKPSERSKKVVNEVFQILFYVSLIYLQKSIIMRLFYNDKQGQCSASTAEMVGQRSTLRRLVIKNSVLIIGHGLSLLYSSIEPEQMETALLSPSLEAMQKAFTRTHHKPAHTATANTHSSQRSHFSQSVETKVGVVRSNITQAMERAAKTTDSEGLSSNEMSVLRVISSKLSIMNRDHLYLLDEGILTLYKDICSLIKSCSKNKVRGTIRTLLKQITHALKILLVDHFVYQEYLLRREDKREAHGRDGTPQSEQQMENGFTEDAELLRQIEAEISKTPMQQLFKQEVRTHQKRMKEMVEVCRICFHRVLLEEIEEHVKNCQKQNTLKQNIEEKTCELAHLKSEMKRQAEEIAATNNSPDFQEDFRLIARIILNERKEKAVDRRRCSLIGVRSERHIGDNLEKLIEDFIEIHEEEPLLRKILNTYKEKVYLEKKLNQIQIHSLHRNENSPRHNKQNMAELRQSTPISACARLNPVDSIETRGRSQSIDQVHQDKNSSNNSLKSESEAEQQSEALSLKLFKSKKALTKKIVKSGQFDELYTEKGYSSLQFIIDTKDKDDISLNNFEILKALGQGAFGKVYMVRRKQTRDIYALKIIKIPEGNIETSLESIKREHEIFKKIAGEHLVKAPFSFSEKSSHIFILEYLPGGDLRRLLNDEVYLDEQRAKAYLAEIILAIEHLHKFNIIHRDLKPENLVFDRLGHLKLTDFGLSEFQMEEKLEKSRKEESERDGRKTRRRRQAVLSNNKQKMKLIGTPDYIAPEIIFKTSLSNFSIDWWSLGVMAYELMVGTRPFCAETIEEVIDNITNFKIEWPEEGYEEGMISPEAKDLICQLLDKDFMHRLGAQGAHEIKSHPFFQSVCWETIKTEKPLAVPKITNVRECIEIQEDPLLKRQIAQFLQKGQRKRTVDLQKFIRFDLLGSETIQNVHKIHEQHSKKLKTLKELQETIHTDQSIPFEDE